MAARKNFTGLITILNFSIINVMYDLFISLVILNYLGRTTRESKPWRRITRHQIRTIKNKFWKHKLFHTI